MSPTKKKIVSKSLEKKKTVMKNTKVTKDGEKQ